MSETAKKGTACLTLSSTRCAVILRSMTAGRNGLTAADAELRHPPDHRAHRVVGRLPRRAEHGHLAGGLHCGDGKAVDRLVGVERPDAAPETAGEDVPDVLRDAGRVPLLFVDGAADVPLD